MFSASSRVTSPVRPELLFDLTTDAQKLVEVVARWRKKDAEDQVSVAAREVLDAREELPGDAGGGNADDQHRGELPEDASLKPAVEPDAACGEAPARGVERGEESARFAVASSLAQKARGRGGNDNDGDQQRKADGGADGEGDVAEELSRFLLDEEHRQEDRQGRRGGCDQGSPDFAGPLQGCIPGAVARFVSSVDAFEHHDGVVDEHADGEGEAGQTDHVERAPENAEDEEGPYDTGGDRHRDDQRRASASKKEEEHHDRQQAADDDVLVDEPDRRFDVLGFVVDLQQFQSTRFEQLLVEQVDLSLHAAHHFDDVGAGFAECVECDRVNAEVAHHAAGLLEADANLGEIANVDGSAVAVGDDGLSHLFGARELSESAHDVAPLALPEVAARAVVVAAAKSRAQRFDAEVARSEALGIDDDLKFLVSPADHVGIGDPGNALQLCFDAVLGEALEGSDIAVGGKQPLSNNCGVAVREFLEPSQSQARSLGLDDAIASRALFGVSLCEGTDLVVVGSLGDEDEPGDRAVGGIRSADDGLVGVLRVLAHLLQTAVDPKQGFVHVGADEEFHHHAADGVHALRAHLP